MKVRMRNTLLVGVILAGSMVGKGWSQLAADDPIVKEIRGLRALPDAERGGVTGKIAREIQALPAGMRKVQLAFGLSNRATEGDPGRENLQAVTTALSMALAETPVPAADDGGPAAPYMEVAELKRYEGMKSGLQDPQLRQAEALLAANEAELEKADFTLQDLQGKSYTLSALRGKVLLVNFWATWCPPCRKEMPDLEAMSKKYKGQGLVILSISDEDMPTVSGYISKMGYTYPILLDPGKTVGKEFHVEGIPKTFVFGRDGKLVTQSIDMRTQGQFLGMLAKAGVKTD